MLRAARRLGRRARVEWSPRFLGAHALPPEANGDKDAYIDEVCAIDARHRRATGSPMRSTPSARASPSRPSRPRACSRRRRRAGPAGQAARRPALQPARRRARRRAWRAVGRPSRIHRRGRRRGHGARPAPWRCCCPAPSTSCARRRCRRSSASAAHGVPMAIATDSNPGTSPLTSLLLDHEHGGHAVPPDGRRDASPA